MPKGECDTDTHTDSRIIIYGYITCERHIALSLFCAGTTLCTRRRSKAREKTAGLEERREMKETSVHPPTVQATDPPTSMKNHRWREKALRGTRGKALGVMR